MKTDTCRIYLTKLFSIYTSKPAFSVRTLSAVHRFAAGPLVTPGAFICLLGIQSRATIGPPAKRHLMPLRRWADSGLGIYVYRVRPCLSKLGNCHIM